MKSAPGNRDTADTGHAGVSANMMKKKNPHKKHKGSVGGTKALSPARRNMVGCRIQHVWKEGGGHAVWKGTVLDQVPVNPSLYLIKYDGFDCVYGLELHKDERVQGLEVLPDRLAKSRLTDVSLADTMIGKAVEHMFETEEGPKEEWRGMVLARAPIMTSWFYITYEKDPVLYMYQLLDDYKEGDLRIMPDSRSFAAEPLRSDPRHQCLIKCCFKCLNLPHPPKLVSSARLIHEGCTCGPFPKQLPTPSPYTLPLGLRVHVKGPPH